MDLEGVLRVSFLNWPCGIRNWPSNLIRFKDADDSDSTSKENIDSPSHDLPIEIHKLSPTDTINNPFIRNKDLGDCM